MLPKLKLFALWLLLVSCLSASAAAQVDLSGLWTGQTSGNQVTIEMRSGGFAIAVTGQRRAGQYGDGQFFRDVGSGRYLFTRPDGQLVKAQVLGPNSLRVTNPDGWTDVFTRSPPVAARNSPPIAVTPKAPRPPEKLPPARPAKMAPWSPKALATNPKELLSPRFAAERADALASCSGSLQQYAMQASKTIQEANLLFEESWLNDSNDMNKSADEVRNFIANVDKWIAAGKDTPVMLAARRAGRCLYQRRVAQLEGSPLATGAVDGSLTPLSIGGQTPPWTQQGKDARIIASDGRSAMDCVKLVELTKSDSRMGGGGRVLSNQCSGPVEIVWCINPGECNRAKGNMWTVQPGRSWPVSANGEVRWAACHGANTAAHVKGSFGLRYYCTAPAKK